jgi:hypothetical protein
MQNYEETKRQHYSRLIKKSDKQAKTNWDIIKRETGKLHLTGQITHLLILKKTPWSDMIEKKRTQN